MTRIAACLATIVSVFAQPDAATVLQPGLVVHRTLPGTERHFYSLRLESGQSAALALDQRGVDVAIRMVNAANDMVAGFDDEIRPEGRERFLIVADAAGDYRFSVGARYAKHDPGEYSVWIEGVRAATPQDRALYDARLLSTDAGRLQAAGKFDEALDKAARAVELAESAIGTNDLYVASLHYMIAALQRSKGQEQTSVDTYLRTIAIYEATVGRIHPKTAFAIESLGILYNVMDEYDKAEPLLREAVSITERTLGDHPRLSVCLRNLALFHTNRGDYTSALDELHRAVRIADRTMSADEFDAIATVNNLGDLYVTLKDYDKALPFVERAVRDIERSMGAENFRVTTPLLNLAVIARERGDYAGALEHLAHAYRIREKTYGAEHTQTASLLISIGNVHQAQGDYQRALDHYARAQAILERTAGPYHSLTLMAINNAARSQAAAGDIAKALELLSRYDALLDKAITFNLAIGSEREKLAYVEQTFERMGRAISLHQRQAAANVEAADLAMLSILRRKGRVLDASLGSRAVLRERFDAGDRALLDELSAVTVQLSTAALNGPGRTPPAEYRSMLARLEKQREELESKISQRSAAYRAEVPDATLAAVRAGVPPGSALVELAIYQPFDPKAATDAAAHGEHRYAAYVIRGDAPTQGVDLGPAKVIDAAVARVRAAFQDPTRTDAAAAARALDDLVLRPVRQAAGPANHLLIAPDGPLNLVPFEALVDERGRFAVERYAITYLGSGRDLLRMQVPHAGAAGPLVIADPAFGNPPPLRAATGRREAGTAAPAPPYFAPLAGTAQEAAAIRTLLPGASVLTGVRATKAALTQAPAPSILHVASHAFFRHDAAATTNPLLRAGIALAGANLPRGSDAGILTALEASNLNLRGTQLVTLSACDTGVGEVKNGEGVYGLRRAFFLAGAETLVMTLWPVSDYVTRSVMTGYYTGLSKGLGRGAALRRVQLSMIADRARRHPFYWAGFIQAGDWTPLTQQQRGAY